MPDDLRAIAEVLRAGSRRDVLDRRAAIADLLDSCALMVDSLDMPPGMTSDVVWGDGVRRARISVSVLRVAAR